jgi:hypothetical protein
MLYNMTDHAYIPVGLLIHLTFQGKERLQKKSTKKVTDAWAKDLRSIVSEGEKGLKTNPFLGSKLLS